MCGFVGVAGGDSVSERLETYFLGLLRVQHRGQESAGGAWSDGQRVYQHKEMGSVPQVFTKGVLEDISSDNPRMLVGHTRYSTSGRDFRPNFVVVGKKSTLSAQPHWIEDHRGRIALASNGDVPELAFQKEQLTKEGGVVFFTQNDAEFLLKKIAFIIHQERPDWRGEYVHGIRRLMETTRATYSAGLLTGTRLYIFRDPYENRPLWIGRRGSLFVAASETCVFDLIKVEVEREVEGGEIIIVEPSGEAVSVRGVERKKPKHCIFEKIYFSRPDSRAFGKEKCSEFRKRLGVRMWHYEKNLPQGPYEVDCAIGVPESGNPFTDGYAAARGIPFRTGFVRDSYIGRTFIMPGQELREIGAERKYEALDDIAAGIYAADGTELLRPMKRIVLGEDSIVRLTTLLALVRKLQKVGFTEIHERTSAPIIKGICPYGIDFKTTEELVGARYTQEEIRDILGVNSLLYNPMAELDANISQGGEDPEDYCRACFSGEYPI